MNLQGRTVFVSGANRGIGKALVEALLGRDVKRIYAAARAPLALPDFKDPRIQPVALDITNNAQVCAAANAAGETNLLLNNAGAATYGSALEDDMSHIQSDMQTNFFGTLEMMRAFVPVLQGNTSPAIVNIVSIAAFVNFPVLGGYSASKAALFSLTQGLRMELAPRGISVHSVNPGPIDTAMAAGFDMDKTSPATAAEAILDGLERGEADIFPDPAGKAMFEAWAGNYRDLEHMVADMLYPH